MNTLEAGADVPAFNTTPIKKANRRKGPKTIFDAAQLKQVRRQLINIVSDRPGKHKGAIASIWVDEFNPEASEETRKTLIHNLMTVLEQLLSEKLIVERVVVSEGGKTYRNLHPREYTWRGEPITIRGIARLTDRKGNGLNVHGLSVNVIRERLIGGMSIDEALTLAPNKTRGALAKRLEESRGDDKWS